MSEKRGSRSDSYQWVYKEILCDFSPTSPASEFWLSDQSLHLSKSEEVLQLEEELINMFWQTPLTDKQSHQLSLIRANPNITQTELAKLTGVNQSTIWKSLHGRQTKDSMTGGIDNRIMHSCLQREPFRAIAQQLYQLDETNRLLMLIRRWFNNNEDFMDWMETELTDYGISKWLEEVILTRMIKYYSHQILHRIGYKIPATMSASHAIKMRQYIQLPKINNLYLRLVFARHRHYLISKMPISLKKQTQPTNKF
jgi:transcriptional regulator with XRE-family HTH domain